MYSVPVCNSTRSALVILIFLCSLSPPPPPPSQGFEKDGSEGRKEGREIFSWGLMIDGRVGAGLVFILHRTPFLCNLYLSIPFISFRGIIVLSPSAFFFAD